MGIIQDQRPRDWAYKVAFKEKDLPSLQEIAKHIRETHDVDMIEDFNSKCEQKLRGENANIEEIEIQAVTKTEDLVVNGGLQQCINIILGTSATRFTHMLASAGGAGGTPTVTDTALDNTGGGGGANSIFPMSTYGWTEARGMKLFFGLVYPQTSDGGSIGNMGVCNGVGVPPVSTLLNREVFTNNALIRGTNIDGSGFKIVFFFSCVVEFCPVA